MATVLGRARDRLVVSGLGPCGSTAMAIDVSSCLPRKQLRPNHTTSRNHQLFHCAPGLPGLLSWTRSNRCRFSSYGIVFACSTAKPQIHICKIYPQSRCWLNYSCDIDACFVKYCNSIYQLAPYFQLSKYLFLLCGGKMFCALLRGGCQIEGGVSNL